MEERPTGVVEGTMTRIECKTEPMKASRYGRFTLAFLGASGILAFGSFTNGADYILLYVSPATNLLALTLLQLFVLVALVPIVKLGEALPVLSRIILSTILVGAALCGTLALPSMRSDGAASALVCVCTVAMGVGNGVSLNGIELWSAAYTSS